MESDVALKPVITLSEQGLRQASSQLIAQMEIAGFCPEAIVGIATGGVRVVAAIPGVERFDVVSCRLSRPETEWKKRLRLSFVLRFLPYRVTDLMRVVEDRLTYRRRRAFLAATSQVDLALEKEFDRIATEVARSSRRRVAIIDDAVDSGVTLALVYHGLRNRLGPNVDLRTAVITKTRSQTALEPDFQLYDMTLCRFPWSFDYKASA